MCHLNIKLKGYISFSLKKIVKIEEINKKKERDHIQILYIL